MADVISKVSTNHISFSVPISPNDNGKAYEILLT